MPIGSHLLGNNTYQRSIETRGKERVLLTIDTSRNTYEGRGSVIDFEDYKRHMALIYLDEYSKEYNKCMLIQQSNILLALPIKSVKLL